MSLSPSCQHINANLAFKHITTPESPLTVRPTIIPLSTKSIDQDLSFGIVLSGGAHFTAWEGEMRRYQIRAGFWKTTKSLSTRRWLVAASPAASCSVKSSDVSVNHLSLSAVPRLLKVPQTNSTLWFRSEWHRFVYSRVWPRLQQSWGYSWILTECDHLQLYCVYQRGLTKCSWTSPHTCSWITQPESYHHLLTMSLFTCGMLQTGVFVFVSFFLFRSVSKHS